MGESVKMPTTEELAGTIIAMKMDGRVMWDSMSYMQKVADIYGLKCSDIFIAHYKKALVWISAQAMNMQNVLKEFVGSFTGLVMTYGDLPRGDEHVPE